MFDHVMLKVRDYEASKAFYAEALKVIRERLYAWFRLTFPPCSGSIHAAGYSANKVPGLLSRDLGTAGRAYVAPVRR